LECLGEIWTTRQKFRRTFKDIRVSVEFDRAFDRALITSVLTWSRRSIGVVGLVFEVRTQVDLGLTNVSRFELADLIISVNDAN
jgi:hypothetical protein